MVKLPWLELAGCNWRLNDLLSSASFERNGSAMLQPGLYVELAGWASHFLKFVVSSG
jgi:hypothetical protein